MQYANAITPNFIARQLASQAESVCQLLLPKGRRKGKRWYAGDVYGAEGDSLVVELSGPKAGIWADFAAAATGKGPDSAKGDLLDLWVATRRISLRQAMEEACDLLGIRRPGKGISRGNWTVEKTYRRPKMPASAKPAAAQETKKSAVFSYLFEERGLSPEALAAYKVSEDGRKILFPFYRDGELINIQHRLIDPDEKGRKRLWTEKEAEKCLFGWQAVTDKDRACVITEAPICAITTYMAGVVGLALPYGAGQGNDRHEWIEKDWDLLAQFDRIYIWLDNDETGTSTALEIAKRLGHQRCHLVSCPDVKDPNEFLENGFPISRVREEIDRARPMDPEELRGAMAFLEDTIKWMHPSDPEGNVLIHFPWAAAETIKIRRDEWVMFIGYSGHGKSHMVDQMALEGILGNRRVCVFSGEFAAGNLGSRLVRQALGQLDMGTPPIEEIRQVFEWLDDNLFFVDFGEELVKPDRILELFTYAHQRYGVEVFIIDPILKCGIPETDIDGQKDFANAIANFKRRYQVAVLTVAHLRKDVDEYKPGGKLATRGSSAWTDLPDTVVEVFRNKKKEQHIKKARASGNEVDQEVARMPDTLGLCYKQRNGHDEPTFGLYWCESAYQFINEPGELPFRYIDHPKGAVNAEDDADIELPAADDKAVT